MRTVVIIDDVLPNALLIKSYMKRLEDVDVRTFTDPHEALALCVGKAPDLVLLDYQMPQMSGIEFLGKFRAVAQLKGVPVVMITGEETKETLYQALESGANDFPSSPVPTTSCASRSTTSSSSRGPATCSNCAGASSIWPTPTSSFISSPPPIN
jgi:putative two-component system response regulator